MRQSIIINPATGSGFNVSNQAYDAASQSKRSQEWNATEIAPNVALSSYLGALRRQSRSAYRNNPYISKGVDNQVSTEVGTGITVRSTTSNEEFRNAANDLFSEFIDDVDPEGVLNLYGQQAQCSRARRVSGEVFIRRRRRSLTSGHILPFQCEVIESDYVPESLNRELKNGNVIISGIEFNRQKKRVAYWMHKFHPGERSTSKYNNIVRVPASDVIHHFLPTRPGQVRGEPVTVQSLVKANTFDQYDDAELVRKKERSKFTGMLTREEQTFDAQGRLADPFTGKAYDDDGSIPSATIEAGTILTGLPGEKLTMFGEDDPGSNYSSFMRWQSISTAAGMKIPYELLTGDWAGVNDRIMRVVLGEYRRQIDMDCDHLMVFQICRRYWHWAIDAGVMSGRLKVGNYLQERTELLKHEWRSQGHPYMHPEQDVNAKSKGIKNGLFSIKNTVASQGSDVDKIMDENLATEKRWHDKRRELGLPEAPFALLEEAQQPTTPEQPEQPPQNQLQKTN